MLSSANNYSHKYMHNERERLNMYYKGASDILEVIGGYLIPLA